MVHEIPDEPMKLMYDTQKVRARREMLVIESIPLLPIHIVVHNHTKMWTVILAHIRRVAPKKVDKAANSSILDRPYSSFLCIGKHRICLGC